LGKKERRRLVSRFRIKISPLPGYGRKLERMPLHEADSQPFFVPPLAREKPAYHGFPERKPIQFGSTRARPSLPANARALPGEDGQRKCRSNASMPAFVILAVCPPPHPRTHHCPKVPVGGEGEDTASKTAASLPAQTICPNIPRWGPKPVVLGPCILPNMHGIRQCYAVPRARSVSRSPWVTAMSSRLSKEALSARKSYPWVGCIPCVGTPICARELRLPNSTRPKKSPGYGTRPVPSPWSISATPCLWFARFKPGSQVSARPTSPHRRARLKPGHDSKKRSLTW